MERILSENEKIRRAEEIYYRRNHKNVSILSDENKKKTKTYLGSKILLEMLILLITTIIVFAVKNKEFIFTKEFLSCISQYNIDLTQKVNGIIANFDNDQKSDSKDTNDNENTQVVEIQAKEEPATSQESVVPENSISENLYQFVKPIEGIVTSRFGTRESFNKNVVPNHTGIDIANECGAEIKSAMSGVVTQVSTEGDYGNHIKISKDNVTTLYAHCQDIYVTEGQEIQIGQPIATIGSTGNSTGPHLHFEIRINDVPVDPSQYIDF